MSVSVKQSCQFFYGIPKLGKDLKSAFSLQRVNDIDHDNASWQKKMVL